MRGVIAVAPEATAGKGSRSSSVAPAGAQNPAVDGVLFRLETRMVQAVGTFRGESGTDRYPIAA